MVLNCTESCSWIIEKVNFRLCQQLCRLEPCPEDIIYLNNFKILIVVKEAYNISTGRVSPVFDWRGTDESWMSVWGQTVVPWHKARSPDWSLMMGWMSPDTGRAWLRACGAWVVTKLITHFCTGVIPNSKSLLHCYGSERWLFTGVNSVRNQPFGFTLLSYSMSFYRGSS